MPAIMLALASGLTMHLCNRVCGLSPMAHDWRSWYSDGLHNITKPQASGGTGTRVVRTAHVGIPVKSCAATSASEAAKASEAKAFILSFYVLSW